MRPLDAVAPRSRAVGARPDHSARGGDRLSCFEAEEDVFADPQGLDLAKKYEHGYRHTAIIHSRNVRNMTIMGREMDTTMYIKNGPCMAGLGSGGEGFLSYSIATPTGEGVTSPLTFTRQRRCTLVDDLHIL